MWLDLHMDVSLGFPVVTLAKLNTNILDNNYISNLLPLTLHPLIVAERTMMFLRGDIDIVCIMHGVYQPTATTTTSTYYDANQLLRLLTVILVDSSQFCDGHVIPQLCAAFYARWNQSSDAH